LDDAAAAAAAAGCCNKQPLPRLRPLFEPLGAAQPISWRASTVCDYEHSHSLVIFQEEYDERKSTRDHRFPEWQVIAPFRKCGCASSSNAFKQDFDFLQKLNTQARSGVFIILSGVLKLLFRCSQ
jgi:hypothetical protein